jgi:aryl-alcohol dehydrogenase-like predicted oxidoreductase
MIPWGTIGHTGLRTTKLGLGTWGFGPIGAPETQVGDDDNLVAVLRAAFGAGLRYVDTAESYANEERLGRLLPLVGAPPDLLIATKCGRSGKIKEGFTADHMRRSVDNSLRDLRLAKLPLLLVRDPRDEDDMAKCLGPAERWRVCGNSSPRAWWSASAWPPARSVRCGRRWSRASST